MEGTYKEGCMVIQRVQETDPCRCAASRCECGKTAFVKEIRKKKAREIGDAVKKCDQIPDENMLREGWENVNYGVMTKKTFRNA